TLRAGAVLAAAGLVLSACASDDGTASEASGITISGSSTVAPITRAVAREIGADVTVEEEGTLAGFESFCTGETVVHNASVPIPGAEADKDFQAQCEENGVEFIELPIALDAVTFVRNKEASFVDDMSMEQLRQLWEADSSVQTWQDLDSSWPADEVGLYGRDAGSGTLAFVEELVLDGGEIREDYRGTHDVRELSSWIADDAAGVGFMGIGNYLATDGQTRLHLTNLTVAGVAPSLAAVQAGDYPLARPLFLYVAHEAVEDDADLAAFVEDYLGRVSSVAPRQYYYPLSEEAMDASKQRFADRTTGTDYDGPGATDVY
ncbi:MAG: substrate-binding domain-containing protein, partial [Micrococcus sp.]|nr:substrate-binding domain-containing protein [Micrococcus sp.]